MNGAPDGVSRDTGYGLFRPLDAEFAKKMSRDTGFKKLAGWGLRLKFVRDTGNCVFS